MPAYATFDLTASHKFSRPGIEVRVDVVNLFDHVYEIRDGSRIGVGAPEHGERRGGVLRGEQEHLAKTRGWCSDLKT